MPTPRNYALYLQETRGKAKESGVLAGPPPSTIERNNRTYYFTYADDDFAVYSVIPPTKP